MTENKKKDLLEDVYNITDDNIRKYGNFFSDMEKGFGSVMKKYAISNG